MVKKLDARACNRENTGFALSVVALYTEDDRCLAIEMFVSKNVKPNEAN